ADYGAIVLAVSHDQFADLTLRQNASQVIFDVKGILADADARL
ncbi:MAG: Vi polysaccharide biosynthesis UDP-N-acetylglucosamine C-6 dehydrogenase TviB, partial [Gammaproteobacteria bacterium]|nr:Vi polysaccharide biosynthesis UDP-N-acetylglucosamine C-6 dehydrogenase TviB [Gammaproteobacteria bacterium]